MALFSLSGAFSVVPSVEVCDDAVLRAPLTWKARLLPLVSAFLFCDTTGPHEPALPPLHSAPVQPEAGKVFAQSVGVVAGGLGEA